MQLTIIIVPWLIFNSASKSFVQFLSLKLIICSLVLTANIDAITKLLFVFDVYVGSQDNPSAHVKFAYL